MLTRRVHSVGRRLKDLRPLGDDVLASPPQPGQAHALSRKDTGTEDIPVFGAQHPITAARQLDDLALDHARQLRRVASTVARIFSS